MKYNWNEQETKALFKLVEEYKKKHKPLLDAFCAHAKKFNRKTLSVRNFYYQKCDEVLNSENLQKKLNINIDMHQKNNFAKFDQRQTDKLLEFIKKRQRQGVSVRKACMEMANNDATMLVRFQNKYEQEKRKKMKDTKKSETSAKKEKDIKNFKNPTNVISFPVEQKLVSQKLTDAEIQSLFLGLVNLIKKSAKQNLLDETNMERQKLSLVIRDTTIQMQQKNEKIERLLSENQKLSKQVLSLKSKIQELRAGYVEKINL